MIKQMTEKDKEDKPDNMKKYEHMYQKEYIMTFGIFLSFHIILCVDDK